MIAPTVGITIGALAGITGAYFGGLTDLIIQRLTDTLMAIPSLVMAMAITISLGFNLWVVILAIAVGIAPYASRLLRSHALVLRSMQYIEASRAIGATNQRIILRHLVPNSWAPWIVMLAVNIGNAIVIEASLSYLGIGIAPPTSSWGNLLIRAASYFTDNPHLVYAPGLMITIVVLCSNIFGDALRDMLDPRLRGAD
ncbi:MAG: ABC transporter permease [Chloroflexi bacterium]|nr:ABC transporter permease [Chloroflexota bacterium]